MYYTSTKVKTVVTLCSLNVITFMQFWFRKAEFPEIYLLFLMKN